MPMMPRPKGKARAICFRILGIPQNMQKRKHSEVEKKINERLLFEETSRAR
ncbi:MAG: hypothetical protein ACHQVS_00790 [Candidatus Babeliales bacterium]